MIKLSYDKKNWASSIELYSLTEEESLCLSDDAGTGTVLQNVFPLTSQFYLLLYPISQIIKVYSVFFSAAPSKTDNLLEITTFERYRNFCASM